MLALLKRLFDEHPTLIVTLCYLLITLIGVLYSFFFYRQFGINIIKFSDLSDFLLISILEPRSILIFVGVCLVSGLLMAVDYAIRRRFKFVKYFAERVFKAKYADPISIIIMVLLFSSIKIQYLADNNAWAIKQGDYDAYEVRLADTGNQPALRAMAVLGSSSRFGYFYDPATKSALVVPIESISYMRKIAKPEAIGPEAAKPEKSRESKPQK